MKVQIISAEQKSKFGRGARKARRAKARQASRLAMILASRNSATTK